MASKVHFCYVHDDIEENDENLTLAQDKLTQEKIDFTTENDVKGGVLEWKGVEELFSKAMWVVLSYTAEFINSPQGHMLEGVAIENALTKGRRNVIVLVPSRLIAFIKESVSVFPTVIMRRDDKSWLDEFYSLVLSKPSGLNTFDICYNPEHVNMDCTTGFVDRRYHSEPDPVSSENDKSHNGNMLSQNYKKRVLKKRRKQMSEKLRHTFYQQSGALMEVELRPNLQWMKILSDWSTLCYTRTICKKDTFYHKKLVSRLVLNITVKYEKISCTSDLCKSDSLIPSSSNSKNVRKQEVTFVLPKLLGLTASVKDLPLTRCGELDPESMFLRCDDENPIEHVLMLPSAAHATPEESLVSQTFSVPLGKTTFRVSQEIAIEGTVHVEIYENEKLCYFVHEVGIDKIFEDLKSFCYRADIMDFDLDKGLFILNSYVDLVVNQHCHTSSESSSDETDNEH